MLASLPLHVNVRTEHCPSSMITSLAMAWAPAPVVVTVIRWAAQQLQPVHATMIDGMVEQAHLAGHLRPDGDYIDINNTFLRLDTNGYSRTGFPLAGIAKRRIRRREAQVVYILVESGEETAIRKQSSALYGRSKGLEKLRM